MTIKVNITNTYNKCRLTIIVNSTDKKCKWHLLSVLSELTIMVNQWQEMSYDKNCQYLSIIEKHWQLLSKITIIGIFCATKNVIFYI